LANSLRHEDSDARAEYAALRGGAGLIDLAHFGVLRVEGRDRVAWLDNLITTNIEKIPDGAGAFGLLLEAKGHVLADFVLLRDAEALWLYTSHAAKENLLANFRRAIFREKVTLADVSDAFSILTLQGAGAQECIRKAFGAFPPLTSLQFSYLQFPNTNHQLLGVNHPRAEAPGYDLIAPREHAAALRDALIAAGARPVAFDALNVARVQAGIAWYGDDYDETTLAPEARLEKFIAPDKGCYPGQEVIARIRNLGHVNRVLVQFQIEGARVPARGDLVFAAGKEVGSITSAVFSFAQNAPLALGYLRQEIALEGARVEIAPRDPADAPRVGAAVHL